MSESDKLLSYEVAKDMFEAFAAWMPEPGQPMPVYDEDAGRYTNKSIERWMNWYADGLIYGVKVPKYDYDPTTEAIKTHANAGLVLEPSSPEVAGRNDYLGKKLFFCPRVNGGVDAGGMPYVTAIEGLDERFSSTEANTWALTPVYYVRYVDIPSAEDPEVIAYVDQQFCDSPREGFVACAGAKLPDGTPRPYILRACYMDSCVDGVYQWSSKSGTIPSSGYIPQTDPEFGNHSLTAMMEAIAQRDDGLSFLCSGDWAYAFEFMQLMLGAKGPGAIVDGSSSDLASYVTARATSTKSVSVDYSPVPPGGYVSLSSTNTSALLNAEARGKVHRARVISLEYASDEDASFNGACVATLDIPDAVSVTTSTRMVPLWWANGSLDGVQGTYGMLYPGDERWGGMQPYKFQNVEWGLGLSEALSNVRVASYRFHASDVPPRQLNDIAKYIGSCPENGYVGDMSRSVGSLVASVMGATLTTGCATRFETTNSSTAKMVAAGGGMKNAGSYPGQIDVEGYGATSVLMGSRLSSIGYSAPAE